MLDSKVLTTFLQCFLNVRKTLAEPYFVIFLLRCPYVAYILPEMLYSNVVTTFLQGF